MRLGARGAGGKKAAREGAAAAPKAGAKVGDITVRRFFRPEDISEDKAYESQSYHEVRGIFFIFLLINCIFNCIFLLLVPVFWRSEQVFTAGCVACHLSLAVSWPPLLPHKNTYIMLPQRTTQPDCPPPLSPLQHTPSHPHTDTPAPTPAPANTGLRLRRARDSGCCRRLRPLSCGCPGRRCPHPRHLHLRCLLQQEGKRLRPAAQGPGGAR